MSSFSDALVPSNEGPKQEVAAIRASIKDGPVCHFTTNKNCLPIYQPERILNYSQLSQVCGTTSNVPVNPFLCSGLQERRWLLLDEKENTKDIVVEVLINGSLCNVRVELHKHIVRGSNVLWSAFRQWFGSNSPAESRWISKWAIMGPHDKWT